MPFAIRLRGELDALGGLSMDLLDASAIVATWWRMSTVCCAPTGLGRR